MMNAVNFLIGSLSGTFCHFSQRRIHKRSWLTWLVLLHLLAEPATNFTFACRTLSKHEPASLTSWLKVTRTSRTSARPRSRDPRAASSSRAGSTKTKPTTRSTKAAEREPATRKRATLPLPLPPPPMPISWTASQVSVDHSAPALFISLNH